MFAQQGKAYYSDPGNELLPVERLRLAAEEPESRQNESCSASECLLAGFGHAFAVELIALTEGDYAEGMYEAIAGLMAIALERASGAWRASAISRTSREEASGCAALCSIRSRMNCAHR